MGPPDGQARVLWLYGLWGSKLGSRRRDSSPLGHRCPKWYRRGHVSLGNPVGIPRPSNLTIAGSSCRAAAGRGGVHGRPLHVSPFLVHLYGWACTCRQQEQSQLQALRVQAARAVPTAGFYFAFGGQAGTTSLTWACRRTGLTRPKVSLP